jgi:hypothetical protein
MTSALTASLGNRTCPQKGGHSTMAEDRATKELTMFGARTRRHHKIQNYRGFATQLAN